MAKLWDLFSAQALTTYMQDVNIKNKRPLFFESRFPAKKQTGLNLAWFKGHNNLPIDLQPGAFDAAIPVRDRQDLAKVETEMPLFREEMALYEQDRQDLLNMKEVQDFMNGSRESQLAKELIDKIYNDRLQLYYGAKSAQEFMRAKLVVSAAFTIANRSHSGDFVSHNYNYDPDGTWTAHNRKQITTAWSDTANSDPLGDCEDMIAYALEDGVVITELVMGAKTFNYMLQNQKIQRNMNGNNVANLVSYSKGATKSYIESYLGVTISVDQQNHKTTVGNTEFYYPQEGNISFLGADILGNTMFGTTPEEADSYSVAGVDFSLVDTGIGITVFTEMKPNITKVTRVSEIVLPSFQNMDAVYNLYWDTTVNHTVSYDVNGGTGTAPASVQVAEGATTTAAAGTGITKDVGGVIKNFTKWNTKADGTGTDYAAGATITMGTANIPLYAQFEA